MSGVLGILHSSLTQLLTQWEELAGQLGAMCASVEECRGEGLYGLLLYQLKCWVCFNINKYVLLLCALS